jgi:ABC-type Na+ efflux pump permease subunit
MKESLTDPVFIVLLIVTVAVIIIFNIYHFSKKKNQEEQQADIADLRKKYYEALRGNDKGIATRAGKDYYTALRGGYLSTADEISIQDDIKMMP